jgi:hypothetical protein
MWWRTDKSLDKSLDKLIDKSLDKAAARNLADHHADRAREGATPENALGADQRKRSAPLRKGVAPSLA